MPLSPAAPPSLLGTNWQGDGSGEPMVGLPPLWVLINAVSEDLIFIVRLRDSPGLPDKMDSTFDVGQFTKSATLGSRIQAFLQT